MIEAVVAIGRGRLGGSLYDGFGCFGSLIYQAVILTDWKIWRYVNLDWEFAVDLKQFSASIQCIAGMTHISYPPIGLQNLYAIIDPMDNLDAPFLHALKAQIQAFRHGNIVCGLISFLSVNVLALSSDWNAPFLSADNSFELMSPIGAPLRLIDGHCLHFDQLARKGANQQAFDEWYDAELKWDLASEYDFSRRCAGFVLDHVVQRISPELRPVSI